MQLYVEVGVTGRSETTHVPAGQLSRALITADLRPTAPPLLSADLEERDSRVFAHPQESIMDTTTLLIIIVLVLVLGGGGFYGRGRWF